MNGAEDEMTRLRGDHGEFNRGQIADLAHQDDVRVLAQGRAQRGRERIGVRHDLALVDEAHLAPVHHLDRIFERDDVARGGAIDGIDERGERGRLPGTRWTADQDEPVLQIGQAAHDRRQPQVLDVGKLARNAAEHSGDAAHLLEDVGAEPQAFALHLV